MVFADVDFYTNEYLLGRAEIIPLAEFLFWARRASERINRNKIELVNIPDELRHCTCEVAEAFFVDSEKQFMAMTPSQSVGAYSKGAIGNLQQDRSSFESGVSDIIRHWLSGSELHNTFVYRGI